MGLIIKEICWIEKKKNAIKILIFFKKLLYVIL